MAFCGNCGNALTESQRFCPACGQPSGGASAAAAPSAPPVSYGQQPPPSGYVAAPSYGGYAQQPWGAREARRSRKGLWIGLASALVVVAVTCVLVFVVFRGDIFGGGAASTPEGTVKAMISAMESRDVDAIYGLLDPDSLDQITSFMSEDDLKSTLKDSLLQYDSIKFSNVEMSTANSGDSNATVTITGGSVSITQDGETTTEDVTASAEPVTFDLVKRDGSWYLDPYSANML
jgi:hypothetical protein